MSFGDQFRDPPEAISGTPHRWASSADDCEAKPAAGGEYARALDSLKAASGVFGQLRSNATVSRSFGHTVANPKLFGYGFETGSGKPAQSGIRAVRQQRLLTSSTLACRLCPRTPVSTMVPEPTRVRRVRPAWPEPNTAPKTA